MLTSGRFINWCNYSSGLLLSFMYSENDAQYLDVVSSYISRVDAVESSLPGCHGNIRVCRLVDAVGPHLAVHHPS